MSRDLFEQSSQSCNTTWRNTKMIGTHLYLPLYMLITCKLTAHQNVIFQPYAHSEAAGTGYDMPTSNDGHRRCRISVIATLATSTQSHASKENGEQDSSTNASDLQGALLQSRMIRTLFRNKLLRIFRTATASDFSSWSSRRGGLYKAPAKTTWTLPHHKHRRKVR